MEYKEFKIGQVIKTVWRNSLAIYRILKIENEYITLEVLDWIDSPYETYIPGFIGRWNTEIVLERSSIMPVYGKLYNTLYD